MATKTDAPKVFISYSWKPTKNKEKTLDIVQKLFSNGVHVIIDIYDLQEGQDKYSFMEKMVTDASINKVLLFCNKEYAEKADSKQGGVGTESLIISGEVYQKAEQTKFLPIIMERDDEGIEYVPTFLKNRIYIDFSTDEIIEDEYEKLLRKIFNRPKNTRPPLGSPPDFIFKEEPIRLYTMNRVSSIRNAFLQANPIAWNLVSEYLAVFISGLRQFELVESQLDLTDFDERIANQINELKVYKDDYVKFLSTLGELAEEFKLEIFISFFERLIKYMEENGTYDYRKETLGYMKFDPFHFLFYELFLYFAAILLKYQRYSELGQILQTTFFVDSRPGHEPYLMNFTAFFTQVPSLNRYRNERLKLNRVNLVADMLKERVNSDHDITFDDLKEADLLLYYINLMTPLVENKYIIHWFPILSAYHSLSSPTINKMILKRNFEKTLPLFGVSTMKELQVRVAEVINTHREIQEPWPFEALRMHRAFDFSKLNSVD